MVVFDVFFCFDPFELNYACGQFLGKLMGCVIADGT